MRFVVTLMPLVLSLAAAAQETAPSEAAPAEASPAEVAPAEAAPRAAPAEVAPAGVAPGGVAPAVVERVRIYVAPFSGETSDPATLDLVEDRVLVAARAAAGDAEVVGARDVQGILDVEAAKAAVGCDTTSCANEIADALNADEIVFGQLGRIGDTWQLTLTRTHRASLRVLGRSVHEARGDTPEGLLDGIPRQAREVFGLVDDGPSGLSMVGMGVTGLGLAGVVAGAVGYTLSWMEYGNAEAALASAAPSSADVQRALKHEADGRGALVFGYVAGGIGAGVALVGIGTWVVGGLE